MKLIKPSFEILEQGSGIDGIYKQIELAGRTCYKSLDKITEDSAKGFVDRMIKSQHYAMLEHGTVYLSILDEGVQYHPYWDNPYSKVADEITDGGEHVIHITTNLRVLVENDWLDDLKYLCEPTEHHEKRVTVRFTTSNSIMREFTRHRSHSFAVESTRYCNYSKDKFNNELTFIKPSWFEGEKCHLNYTKWTTISTDFFPELDPSVICDGDVSKEDMFIWSLLTSEKCYLDSIKSGAKPQEAREVLPLATKCDMVMTGFVSDWEHFFRLRTSILAETGKPHPDASALADPLYREFVSRSYMKSLV